MTLVERLAKRRAKVELYTAYDRPSERCEKDARWWLNALCDEIAEQCNPHEDRNEIIAWLREEANERV